MIEVTLPFPPSTNNLFSGRGRRYVARPYQRWRAEAGWELRRQKVKPTDGPVVIKITLTPPDKRRRDASNYVKAIEDLLVHHGLIDDDSGKVVKGVSASWAEQPGEPGAFVRVTPA